MITCNHISRWPTYNKKWRPKTEVGIIYNSYYDTARKLNQNPNKKATHSTYNYYKIDRRVCFVSWRLVKAVTSSDADWLRATQHLRWFVHKSTKLPSYSRKFPRLVLVIRQEISFDFSKFDIMNNLAQIF